MASTEGSLVRPFVREQAPSRSRARWSHRLRTFFTVVVVVQGLHMAEHVIQLLQVHLFGVPEDDALGLLGYVIEFHDTEEWLHLGFNSLYLASLWLLAWPLARGWLGALPRWAVVVFLLGAVAFESWHTVEHGVIISNVIANNGCPCPGIVDRALGVTDTTLHSFYNAVAYAATVVPWILIRRAGSASR